MINLYFQLELLFPAPVGLGVVTLGGQLLYIRSIRQHRPNLIAAGAVGLKHNVAAVGGPAREIVSSRVVRQLHPLLAGGVHQINVIGARFSGAVLALP